MPRVCPRVARPATPGSASAAHRGRPARSTVRTPFVFGGCMACRAARARRWVWNPSAARRRFRRSHPSPERRTSYRPPLPRPDEKSGQSAGGVLTLRACTPAGISSRLHIRIVLACTGRWPGLFRGFRCARLPGQGASISPSGEGVKGANREHGLHADGPEKGDACVAPATEDSRHRVPPPSAGVAQVKGRPPADLARVNS